MDIYDDLERFKKLIQHNTHFHQFELSRSHEMTMSKCAIFSQLDEQFSNQLQSRSDTELDSSTSLDSNLPVKHAAEKNSEASIFDSVSKISSKQSLERLLNSTGLAKDHDTSFLLAGND